MWFLSRLESKSEEFCNLRSSERYSGVHKKKGRPAFETRKQKRSCKAGTGFPSLQLVVPLRHSIQVHCLLRHVIVLWCEGVHPLQRVLNCCAFDSWTVFSIRTGREQKIAERASVRWKTGADIHMVVWRFIMKVEYFRNKNWEA